MHAGRTDDRAAGIGAGIIEASAQRGADDIDVTEHSGRAFGEPRDASGFGRKLVMGRGTIDDLGQHMLQLFEAEEGDDVVIVAAGAEIAEAEIGFGRVGGALAGQPEIEPVLAMERRCDAVQHVGRMVVHPAKLRALLAGGEPHAGA
ncbi:hypothetical protein D9M70_490900 [compost metagenome]